MFINKSEGEKLSKILNDHKVLKCKKAIFHKPVWFLTPEICDRYGVKYDFVVHRAGDMVIVNNTVLHSVINNGLNCATAINFALLPDADFVDDTICDCRSNQRSILHAVGRLSCYEHGYYNFKSLQDYNEHVRKDHGGLMRYGCPFKDIHKTPPQACDRSFTTRDNWYAHYRHVHLGERRHCPVCGIEQWGQNMNRHIMTHTRPGKI